MQKLTISILSENGNFPYSIKEVLNGVENGNRTGRGENDTDSYEWEITNLYE